MKLTHRKAILKTLQHSEMRRKHGDASWHPRSSWRSAICLPPSLRFLQQPQPTNKSNSTKPTRHAAGRLDARQQRRTTRGTSFSSIRPPHHHSHLVTPATHLHDLAGKQAIRVGRLRCPAIRNQLFKAECSTLGPASTQ